MKKIVVSFLLLCMVFVACSCSEPSAIEKAQQRAVEIGEQYLDYKLAKAEAKELLDSIVVPETEGNGQTYLEADIAYLSFIIGKQGSTYEDIQKKVEYIKSATYQ